jgi:hypothetical protein
MAASVFHEPGPYPRLKFPGQRTGGHGAAALMPY